MDVAKYALERKPDNEFTDPTEEEGEERFHPLLWACFRGCESRASSLMKEQISVLNLMKARLPSTMPESKAWMTRDHIQKVKRARFVKRTKEDG